MTNKPETPPPLFPGLEWVRFSWGWRVVVAGVCCDLTDRAAHYDVRYGVSTAQYSHDEHKDWCVPEALDWLRARIREHAASAVTTIPAAELVATLSEDKRRGLLCALMSPPQARVCQVCGEHWDGSHFCTGDVAGVPVKPPEGS